MPKTKLRFAPPQKRTTRHRRGEAHQNAKFTAAQVRAIRKDRRTYRAIASAYACSTSTVWLIKHRWSYTNVPG